MNDSEHLHPLISKAVDSLKRGHISRREFLRLATLLGVSATTATWLSGCDDPTSSPEASAPSTIKRGGTLRIGGWVGTTDDIDAKVLRKCYEHLTWIDADNISHPYLLESWQANDDLTVWTLNLKGGISWSNGDKFIAEDVVQTLRSRITEQDLFMGALTVNGVEAVDDSTVTLELEKSTLDVPEILADDVAFLTHRDEINRNPFDGLNSGTGPFILDSFEPNQRAYLVRREGYWQRGVDGEPLPYLKAIEYLDLGLDELPYLEFMQQGMIDTYFPLANEHLDLRDDSRFKTQRILTSWTQVLRFQVDKEPWNDNRVRLAVKKLQDRQKILDRAYLGEGVIGYDTHVSPAHPAFSPMEDVRYDPESAKALLAEAGIEKLSFTIAIMDEPIAGAYAETLREDAREAGVEIKIEKMPGEDYWSVWKTAPVGITTWQPRTLATTVLRLAYTADEFGNPADWNESHWVDEEFSELLVKAEVTRDVDERRKIMAELQRIQSDRGSVGIAFWTYAHFAINDAFKDAKVALGDMLLQECWYDVESDPFA